MRSLRKTGIMTLTAACAMGCMTAAAFAAPSISSLHETEEKTTIQATSTDGTNTAEILSKSDTYASVSVSEQYMTTDKDGKLVATPLSDLIDLSSETISEEGNKGYSIPDSIPSVEEILESYSKAAKVELPEDEDVDLKTLDQVTYWQDFKYATTNYRVAAGDTLQKGNQTATLDDGMIEAEIEGGEILRSGDIDDFKIIQIDAATGEIYYLTMKEYDAETGTYVVEFPCVGPYMIVFDQAD